MLALEALFKYQSREMKDQILNNYGKHDGSEAPKLGLQDDNIVYENEEIDFTDVKVETEEVPVEDKN